jgi:hypothetical protein
MLVCSYCLDKNEYLLYGIKSKYVKIISLFRLTIKKNGLSLRNFEI